MAKKVLFKTGGGVSSAVKAIATPAMSMTMAEISLTFIGFLQSRTAEHSGNGGADV